MPIRFVFLTDSHYHPAAPKDFGAPKLLTRGREVLAATVPAVNALKPQFVLHGGDLLCGGGSFEIPQDAYLQSIADVADTYARLEAPLYIVPGNHDCDAQERSFAHLGSRFAVPQALDIVEVAPGLRLALANTYHDDPWSGAGVWTETLDRTLRAADAEARRDGTVVLLVLHAWVLPGYDGEGGMVDGSEALLETLRACPSVTAVMTGHRHINRVRPYRDLLEVDTACLIGFPVGFRELILDEDGLLTGRFHQLDLPDFIQASRERATPDACNRYLGEGTDRDFSVLLPRARGLRR